MAKNFSSVTPQSMAGRGAPTSAPRPGQPAPDPTSSAAGSGRRKLVYAIGAAGLIGLLVVLIGLFTRGGGGDEGATPQGPHGPSEFVNGVPSGYTRDKGGAATAAVNFLQADDQAMAGRLDIAHVEKALVAENPAPKLVSMLDHARGRQVTGDTFVTLPATVTVQTISPDAADVSVWALGSGSLNANGAGDMATVATWSTTDLHLVWEDGDWNVQDYAFRVGPQPGEVTKSGQEIETGYYSFFVN